MKAISTKGGVGGGVLLLREGCETDYYYAGRGDSTDRLHSTPPSVLMVCSPLQNGPRHSPKNGLKNGPVHILPYAELIC